MTSDTTLIVLLIVALVLIVAPTPAKQECPAANPTAELRESCATDAEGNFHCER